MTTPTLSTGQPSTLGVWLNLTRAAFGPSSAATAYLVGRVEREGEDMEVLADETQFLHALMTIHRQLPPDETP